MTRAYDKYRTRSHAGFPKGSYLIPNPLHFHIACERHIALRRPQITSIASHYIPFQQSTFKTKIAKITVNLDDSHTVSLNIPVETVTKFIHPFASALNLKNDPIRSNKDCQTSYINNSEYIPSSTHEFNQITYTPLYVDSYKTCQPEQESTEKSRLFEKRILENLEREIHLNDFIADSSDTDVSVEMFLDDSCNNENNKQIISEGTHSSSSPIERIDYAKENKELTDYQRIFTEIVTELSNIIREYIKQLHVDIRESIIFSNILHDSNKIKLMNNLISSYTKYCNGKFQPDKNELRVSLTTCTLNGLEMDDIPLMDQIFNVSEVLNNILNHFLNLTQSFNSPHYLTEQNSMTYQSTPKQQRIKNGQITSFKKRKNSKSGSESYWITLGNTSASDKYCSSDNIFLGTSEELSKKSSPVYNESSYHSYICENSVLSDLSDSYDSNTISSYESETNILENSAKFFRTIASDTNTHIQHKSGTFKLSLAVKKSENKENIPFNDDSGDWMGYERAKF